MNDHEYDRYIGALAGILFADGVYALFLAFGPLVLNPFGLVIFVLGLGLASSGAVVAVYPTLQRWNSEEKEGRKSEIREVFEELLYQEAGESK